MDFGTIFAVGNNNTAGDVDASGSVAAVATPADSAYLSMALDGTLTTTAGTTAALNALGATGTPGVFDITVALASTQVRFSSTAILDADSTAASVSITDGTDTFIFTDLLLDVNNDNTADNDTIGDGLSGTVFGTTDGGGLLTIRAAGRLYTTYTDTTDNKAYGNGAYTGSYTLVVSY